MLTNDGLKIHTTEWLVDNPKANFYIVHGYAEHANRYDHLAEFLNKKKMSVYSFDLRGFGRSEGDRAYIDHFNQYTNDLDIWLYGKLNKNLPHFLFGHSLGGLIVTSYLLDNPSKAKKINGSILSGPALMPAPDLAPMLLKFSSIIGKLFPRMKTVDLESDRISKDPEVVKAYNEDPLVYQGKWIARTGSSIVDQMNKVQGRTEEFNFPIFIAHGESDRLANIEGSKKFFDHIESEDKTFRAYPNMHHELVNEPEKEVFMKDILDWMKKRI